MSLNIRNGDYESWFPFQMDLIVLVVLSVVLYVGLEGIVVTIPNSTDIDFHIQNTESVWSFVTSRRMVGLTLLFMSFGFGAWAFYKSKAWRVDNWYLVTWICRVLRWSAATALVVDYLVFGNLDPVDFPLAGPIFQVPAELFRYVCGHSTLYLLGFAFFAALVFSLAGVLGRALQFALVGVSATQFLVLESISAYYDKTDMVLVSFVAAIASIVHLDTMMPSPEEAFETRMWKYFVVIGACVFFCIVVHDAVLRLFS